jgi:hypothetical protein
VGSFQFGPEWADSSLFFIDLSPQIVSLAAIADSAKDNAARQAEASARLFDTSSSFRKFFVSFFGPQRFFTSICIIGIAPSCLTYNSAVHFLNLYVFFFRNLALRPETS